MPVFEAMIHENEFSLFWSAERGDWQEQSKWKTNIQRAVFHMAWSRSLVMKWFTTEHSITNLVVFWQGADDNQIKEGFGYEEDY